MSEFHYRASDQRVADISDVLKDMVNGYLEAAMFTDSGDDMGISADDVFAHSAVAVAYSDCAAFLQVSFGLLVDGEAANKLSYTEIGHNFWYTRNHHGTGFWDRGLGDAGEKLTNISHAMGPACLYLGDDGRVYFG